MILTQMFEISRWFVLRIAFSNYKIFQLPSEHFIYLVHFSRIHIFVVAKQEYESACKRHINFYDGKKAFNATIPVTDELKRAILKEYDMLI